MSSMKSIFIHCSNLQLQQIHNIRLELSSKLLRSRIRYLLQFSLNWVADILTLIVVNLINDPSEDNSPWPGSHHRLEHSYLSNQQCRGRSRTGWCRTCWWWSCSQTCWQSSPVWTDLMKLTCLVCPLAAWCCVCRVCWRRQREECCQDRREMLWSHSQCTVECLYPGSPGWDTVSWRKVSKRNLYFFKYAFFY